VKFALGVEKLLARELREEIHALLLDQFREPFHDLAERDDVVAVIRKRRRRDRKFERASFGQIVDGVAGDRRVKRRGLLEVRHEFAQRARVHDRARELVGAHLPRLFKNVDILGGKRRRFLGLGVLLDQVGEVQGAGKASWACADNQDICFELFPFNLIWHLTIL
jgi:hypothetical protein